MQLDYSKGHGLKNLRFLLSLTMLLPSRCLLPSQCRCLCNVFLFRYIFSSATHLQTHFLSRGIFSSDTYIKTHFLLREFSSEKYLQRHILSIRADHPCWYLDYGFRYFDQMETRRRGLSNTGGLPGWF